MLNPRILTVAAAISLVGLPHSVLAQSEAQKQYQAQIQAQAQPKVQTPPVVSCKNPQALQQSLTAILSDYGRVQQLSIMQSFFRISFSARSARHLGYSTIWGYDKKYVESWAKRSTNAFLDDGRMDDNLQAYRGSSRIGHSTRASYNKFIDYHCWSVEGMDAQTILSKGADKKFINTLRRGKAWKEARQQGRTVGERY